MLCHLTLKDFAVVSQADLGFGPGLTVISGETGAGKSLLVDALLWLTGARADAGIVRFGAERAELAAEFDLVDAPAAAAWLREHELDDDGGCQLRRIIKADGGSRAWINGRPATLGQLADLGELLLEIHGQHEHQALLERGHQLDLLDAFGRHGEALTDVQACARRWASVDAEHRACSGPGDTAERLAWLEHQLAELEAERLDPAEIADLLAAHRRQAHAASLAQGCDQAWQRLANDEGLSLSRHLRQLRGELSRLTDLEPRLSEVLALLESADIQLDEAAGGLARIRDDLDLDPARLQQLEDRLSRLHELARKHRLPLDQLAERREALRSEQARLHGAGATIERLQREQAELEQAWRRAAERLSAARRAAAANLGPAVSGLMAELGMAGGLFQIQFDPMAQPQPNPQGVERIEFMVSANAGQPPRPLRKTASGGELARISLAIEVAALGLDTVPSMIFDEVDSGIGGAVAEVVGQKLRALGEQRQVLCVTHLPQVAAQGHRHYQVSKASNGASTHSAVQALDGNERIEELARMLGGIQITPETRAHARQMLGRAQA